MRLATLALLAAAVLAASGCVPIVIGAGAAAYSTLEDRRSTGTQIDDESIEVRSANRITDRFGDSVHVNITSFSHMALVTGEVPDAKAKEEVDKIVRAVPTVRGVTNDLQVAGLSSMGSRTNDSYLTSKVKARLLDSQSVSPLHVKVVTESGVVYLLGIVTEAEADEAVELARTTGGVRKVVKVFEYCKPTDEICKPHSAPQPPPTSTRQRP